MPRLFIACHVPIQPPLRDIARQIGRLDHRLRTVPPENWHVTLCFLGQTDHGHVPEIATMLDQVAARHPPFPLRLRGVGAFPDTNRPTVFWVGIEPNPVLSALVGRLQTELSQWGFEPEKRPYAPHLTLARVNPPVAGNVAELCQEHAGSEFGLIPVTELLLIESLLERTGSVYRIRRRHPLNPGLN